MTGHRLIYLVRPAWVALAAFTSWTFANGVRVSVGVCRVATRCPSGDLSTATVRALHQRGFSIHEVDVVATAFPVAALTLWLSLGALILWRKPEDRGALLCALFLAIFPAFISASVPFVFFFLALILFGLLFPDGRFAPRWTRWLALVAVIASSFTIVSDGIATLADAMILIVVLGLQVYRFRVISPWSQRQQTKWTVSGLVLAVLGFAAVLSMPSANGSLVSALKGPAFVVAISAIPVSIGISILRNQLWDIDRIISRAVSYAILSAMLAGLYVAGVVGFQRLFQIFTGRSSAIAIAASTLAIATLFGPLRHRIQAIIDRRFYRAKYDAARTVAAFAHGLRDEVDLAQLSHDITSVVQNTLQPEHVSLWLGGEAAPPPPSIQSRRASSP